MSEQPMELTPAPVTVKTDARLVEKEVEMAELDRLAAEAGVRTAAEMAEIAAGGWRGAGRRTGQSACGEKNSSETGHEKRWPVPLREG